MSTTTETLSLPGVVQFFEEHGIDPDDYFTADSGKDYGDVRAWGPIDGKYLIAYGDNAQTDYTLADDVEDLAGWLESPDVYGYDKVLQTASVRGLSFVQEADEPEEGQGAEEGYRVLVSRDFYGPFTLHAWADEDGKTLEFATYEEAQDWIDEQESGAYCCAHNESNAPTYTIITA